MKKQELIARAYQLFSQYEKPLHSTNYKHCEECKEYDELLNKITREQLSIEDIGTECWGPIPFLLPEATAYYMPRLIELALENVNNKDQSPYINQFINQTGTNPNRKSYSLFMPEHKQVIYQALEFINQNYRVIVEEHCWENGLDETLAAWHN